LSMSIFVFQAEDGIRDRNVTGVQTCALPILAIGMIRGVSIALRYKARVDAGRIATPDLGVEINNRVASLNIDELLLHDNRNSRRSEERRVGKECRKGRSRRVQGETKKRK